MSRSADQLQDPDATSKTPARGLRWVFIGTQGLRAGWGVLLFAILVGVAAVVLAVGMAVAGVGVESLKRPSDTAQGMIQITGLALVCVSVATLLMGLIERRGGSAYGLSPRGMAGRLGHGLLAGVLLLSLLVGALVATGSLKIDRVALQGTDIARQAALWGVACLMIGLFEESLLRGYVLAKLSRGLGLRWAAILTSVVFGAGHIPNTGEGFIGLLHVVLIGLVFAYSVWKTGSLWWAIGFHAAWDWAQSFLWGVGDSGLISQGRLLITHVEGPAWLSGGSTGPEGSVLSLLAIAAAAAWLRWGVKRPDGEAASLPLTRRGASGLQAAD